MTAKRPRKWLRWVMPALLLLVGALVLLGLAARTPQGRAYAGREATRLIREQVGLMATIAEVDVDPAGLAVVGRGIQLDHPIHGRFAEAEVLRIRPSWWALLRGRLDLHTITIEGATLSLTVRDGKVLNMPDFPKASGEPHKPTELPFDYLNIKRSRLAVDANPLASGEISQIDILLDASSDGVIGVELHSSRGFVDHPMGRDLLEHLEFIGNLTPDNIQVHVAHFQTPQVRVRLSEGGVNLPLGDAYHGNVELSLELPQLARWPHGYELPNLEGRLEISGNVVNGAEGLRGDAEIKLHDGVVKWYGLGQLVDLSVHADTNKIEFDGLARLTGEDGGEVGLAGELGLGEGLPLAINADVRNVSFSRLMEQLNVSKNAIVKWTLAGGFDLKGSVDPLNLRGSLHMPTRNFEITQDAWHQMPVRHILGVERALLDGRVAVRSNAIFLENIDITMPRSKLHTEVVMLGFDNELKVRGRALELDLADVTPLLKFPLAGKGNFDVEVDGTFMDPVVRGKLQMNEFAFNTYPFGNLASEYALEKDAMAVRFPRIEAVKNDSKYAARDLLLDFSDHRFRASANLEIGRLALSDFYHAFHYQDDERYLPYQGVVKGTAAIDYTLGFPEDGDNGTMIADIDVDVPQAELVGYAVSDGHFSGRWKWLDHERGYRGGELNVERFSLQKGQGTVNVSGKMGQEGVLDFVAVGDRIAIKDTEGIRDRLSGLQGTYGVTASIKGTVAVPRASIDLVGTGLRYDGEHLGDGRAYVRLTDREDPWVREALNWEPGKPPQHESCGHGREGLARGHWPADPPLKTVDGPQPVLERPMAWVMCGEAMKGQLRVDLAAGRTDEYPLRGMITANKLRFGKLLPRGAGREPLNGSTTGELVFSGGAMLKPHTLGGRLKLTALTVGQRDVELRNNGPVDVRFGKGSFHVKNADLIGPSSQLYVSGGGSTQGLALNFDGNVDLGLISTLSQTVTEASGRVDLHFKVTGRLARPAVYGEASVREAALRIASFPERISGVNGRITFTQRRMVLEDFSARLAGGQLAWKGSASLKGQRIGGYQLDIEADGIQMTPRDGVDLRASGRYRLAWNDQNPIPALTGTLRLDGMEYTRPIKVGRTLQDMYKNQRADVEDYDPAQDMLSIDLRIVQTQPLFIRNNLIDAELNIEDSKRPFRLMGTDQRFGVVGNMTVHKGTVRFRDAEFDIREGEITFNDRTRVDPTFDIRAVTDVRRKSELTQTDWHIGIHAWGSRDAFQFELSSDPYLSEDDIALLLTTGMTHAELAQLEAGDLGETAALEALATVTGVEREVHRAVPAIDDIHVASSYSERSNRTEPQLFLGKRIAERVRLSASTGLAESRDFSTGVELEISDETSVEAVYNNQNSTSASQLGDVGVDLKWRLEFD